MQKSNGKEGLHGKKKLMTRKLNTDLKKRIVKRTIWSVALYAAETWTLTETLRKKLEAFESWVWTGMLKISWTEIIQMKKFGKELVKQIHLKNNTAEET